MGCVGGQFLMGVWGWAVPDGVCGGQLCHGDVAGSFVGHQGVLSGLLAVVAGGELGQVPEWGTDG